MGITENFAKSGVELVMNVDRMKCAGFQINKTTSVTYAFHGRKSKELQGVRGRIYTLATGVLEEDFVKMILD